ncbi:MAG: DUF2891 family protein, partial [Phaeodactylibacter sp.]|nr:DUF2891 family protein [Phaeodactylibacter sp.]
MKFLLSSLLCMLTLMLSYAQPGQPYVDYHIGQLPILTDAGASLFTGQAMDCLQKEYPNKLNQVLPDSTMLQEPHQLHPAFYGCFDWHSAVHGHWMLV